MLEQAESVRFADPAVRDAHRQGAEGGGGGRRARLAHRCGCIVARARRSASCTSPISPPRRFGRPPTASCSTPRRTPKQATLQGWATLENFSGQDWSGVDLTLVSGRPVAYRQALYRAYMVDRPEAPLDLGAQLDPGIDRGGLAAPPTPRRRHAKPDGALRRAASRTAAMPMTAPRGARRRALSPAAPRRAAAQEGETHVAFHLPFPSASPPAAPCRCRSSTRERRSTRVAIYDPHGRRAPSPERRRTDQRRQGGAAAGHRDDLRAGRRGRDLCRRFRLSATPAGCDLECSQRLKANPNGPRPAACPFDLNAAAAPKTEIKAAALAAPVASAPAPAQKAVKKKKSAAVIPAAIAPRPAPRPAPAAPAPVAPVTPPAIPVVENTSLPPTLPSTAPAPETGGMEWLSDPLHLAFLAACLIALLAYAAGRHVRHKQAARLPSLSAWMRTKGKPPS